MNIIKMYMQGCVTFLIAANLWLWFGIELNFLEFCLIAACIYLLDYFFIS